MAVKKSLLIIGAKGYIGAYLSSKLTEEYDVDGVVRRMPEGNEEVWRTAFRQIYLGDMTDESFVTEISQKQYDAVIYLVSLDHTESRKDPAYVAQVNVIPYWSLLRQYSERDYKTRIIYFSTQQVYGRIPAELIKENRELAVVNQYGLTHQMCEQVSKYYSKVTNSTYACIRLSNGYGAPKLKENNCWSLVTNDLCQMAYRDNKIALLSDGSPMRDFIHLDDVCRAVSILLNVDKPQSYDCYNVASSETHSILSLASKVQDVYYERTKTRIPIIGPDSKEITGLDQFSERERFQLDTSKMKSLGFSPSVTLEEGIESIFDYLSQS